MNAYENDRILRITEVTSITGLSKTGVYEAIKKNTFPQQVHISERSIGFLKSEIDTWMQERINARKGVSNG